MSMLGAYEVGLFSASVRITEAWLFIPVALASTFYPNLINAKKVSVDFYNERTKALYGLISIIAIFAAIFVSVFSESILMLSFGDQYKAGATVLVIRIWETVFAAISIAAGKWVLIENLQKKTVLFMVLGATSNVLMNSLMIPIYGIEGAAFASVFSIAITVMMAPLIYKEFRTNVAMRVNAFFLLYTINAIKLINNMSLSK
jgi:O-antigen/teichoic acid export membrane protein